MSSRTVSRSTVSVPRSLAASSELLVCLDIDGTIVDYDGSLHPVVEKGIRAMRRCGARVVLATGRGIGGVLPIAERLGITSEYAVCANGAVVIELGQDPGSYEITDVVTFDPRAALTELREVVPGAVFLVDDAHGRHFTTGAFPAGELAQDPPVIAFEEICQLAASRVTVRAPELSAAELGRLVAASGLQGVEYSVGWTAWMDISPQGVTKASALEMLRGRLDIAAEATVAAGDGTNDLDMLSWAHFSVAMGQASQVVKDHADAQTLTVADGGLAYLLSAILTR